MCIQLTNEGPKKTQVSSGVALDKPKENRIIVAPD